MKKILERLNKIAGIRGSMVMTQDGIMVAEAFGPDLDDDVVAAIASSLLTSLNRSLSKIIQDENIIELALTASDGKMIFLNLGNSYLVVVAKHDVELETTMVEIKSAAHHIQNRTPSKVRYKQKQAGT